MQMQRATYCTSEASGLGLGLLGLGLGLGLELKTMFHGNLHRDLIFQLHEIPSDVPQFIHKHTL